MLRVVATAVFVSVSYIGLERGGHPEMKTEIDGTWEVIRHIVQGKNDESVVRSNYIVVRANGVQSVKQGGKPVSKFRFRLEEGKKPKQITFMSLESNRILNKAIYEINGDSMKI